MKTISRIVAAASAAGFVFAATPSMAQYANEYSPAKLISRGNTTKDIAGNGTVIVQVQVNADGSHKVIKVIKSTNSGDNDAAMDIAEHSSYRPAHQGPKAITAFYDFTLKFKGKSISSGEDSGGSAGSAGIEGLIRSQHYKEAQQRASAALLANPSDDRTRQLLGLAAFYNNDYDTSASAFARVSSVSKQFQAVAAQALASAAIEGADKNPSQALAYAQKGVALGGGTTSQLALGVAQLANGQKAEALTTLKAVHQKIFADPKTDSKVKVGVDSRLLNAYLANGDSAGAQQTASEMKQLDPSNNVSARVMGNYYLKLGGDALASKNYAEAQKNFDLAAGTGDPEVAVTANTQAAFTLLSGSDKPDAAKVKGYADKAVAAKPDSAEANYAEGVAYVLVWANSHKDDDKKQATTFLNKADSLAKAQGNTALSLQIETFIKNNIK